MRKLDIWPKIKLKTECKTLIYELKWKKAETEREAFI